MHDTITITTGTGHPDGPQTKATLAMLQAAGIHPDIIRIPGRGDAPTITAGNHTWIGHRPDLINTLIHQHTHRH